MLLYRSDSLGTGLDAHLYPCPQELYQFGRSRELVAEYVALDLQNRKSEGSAQKKVSTWTH